MKVCVCNLKGGVGKTTTAVCLAEAFAVKRDGVVLVDADPQASALGWAEAAAESGPGLRASVIGLPSVEMGRRLASLDLRSADLVVDTPPGDTRLVLAAMEIVDVAVIPVQASLMDLDRLRPTLALAEKAGVATAIILSRVRLATRSLDSARRALDDLELPVLRAVLPQRERVAAAYGTRPSGLVLSAFDALAHELSSTLAP